MKKYFVEHYQTIDSTNKFLKDNHDKYRDFSFVYADYQTNGRGRNDRLWRANRGDNLLFSLLIKNKDILKYSYKLSLITAHIISNLLIEKYHVSNLKIKWPNDIYVNDKKICGILLEGNSSEYLIIGIGLNVNQNSFVGEYRINPTSLFIELSQNINIDELRELLFTKLYEDLHHIDLNKTVNFINENNFLRNLNVNFQYDNETLLGIVIKINDDFSLAVKVEDKIYNILSNEISCL